MRDIMHNRDTGKLGEAIAVAYLRESGFEILKTNFQSRIGEVDIIARRPGRKGELCVHFIEVKYRMSDRFGLGREAVGHAKQKKIHQVAQGWLVANGMWQNVDISFDVIDIMAQSRHTSGASMEGVGREVEHLIGCF